MKPKPIVAWACIFSRALCRLRVITTSFDWFSGFPPFFLIGQSIRLFLVLRHSIETRSIGFYSLPVAMIFRLPMNTFLLTRDLHCGKRVLGSPGGRHCKSPEAVFFIIILADNFVTREGD